MIDSQTVAQIIDTAQIVDVVGDFVSLRRRGVNYLGLCPFHDEKTGSFTVSPAKGIFKCFGCGKAGGAVNFIMEHEQLDYPGALRYLAKKYNIPIQEKELTAEEQQTQSDREGMFTLNIWAQRYFVEQMNNTDLGRSIGLGYFKSRGFTDETIEKFGLGYCLNQPDSMSSKALSSGYKAEYIEKCGLGARRDNGTWYDRFRGRVIFPVHTLSGKIVAFGGRILEKNDKTAKYVNSPESDIYHKSNELYGIYFAKHSIVKYNRCFLVEGYTDVISMHQSGVANTVASSGTALTQGQIKLIRRFTPNITVIYDGDNAGIKASLRGIDLLLEQGMNVNVVLLPEGEDPDSYAQSHSAVDFVDFINENQVDFIRFKIKLLLEGAGNDPIKRAELITEVVRSISLIPDQITRSVYIKECSKLLDIEENIVLSEIQKNLRSQHSKQLAQSTARPAQTTTPSYRQESAEQQSTPDVNLTYTDNKNPFLKQEQEILRYIIRHGNEVIFTEENDENETINTTVNQFILESIADTREDGKLFKSITHQKIIQTIEEIEEQDKISPLIFSNHPDPEVSKLAAELLSDRYELSKIHTKVNDYIGNPNDTKAIEEHNHKIESERINTLGKEICTVINEYKAAIILHQEQQLDLKIRQAQEAKNDAEIMELIQQKQTLLYLKKQVHSSLGNRVVIKPIR
ncbi:MAG: DNA primase [bacterium]